MSLDDFFAETTEPVDPLRADLIAMIRARDDATPRHRQRELGPSEVSHPCMRRMAFGMLEVSRCNPQYDPLPSIIGTATHKWLESAAKFANQQLRRQRWLVETRVNVAPGLSGSCDLFDLDTATVVDWKGLSLDTLVPIPSGWTTISQIQVGDEVFDINGKPTSVTAISPIFERDCYRITFEDNISVVCDDVHQWVVKFGQDAVERTMTISAMAEKLRDPSGQSQIRIVNPLPIDLPESSLPIEPYLLGAWIGDGFSNTGKIGKPDKELFDNIENAGSTISSINTRNDGLLSVRIKGLTKALRLADLLGNKHIPPNYLRSSYPQRLELLRGLMDTDGSYNRIRNQAVFCTNHKSLAHDFAELVTTLGWKPRIWELQKTGFGKTITAYDVTFIPFDANPFRLTRKANLVRLKGTTRARRRFIKSIERTLTTPTRCITVDNISQTFLCTEAMIPTHNCVGYTSFTAYVKDPGPVYKNQVHLYGKGFENAGQPVKRVAIAFLPRAGTLHKMHLWSEDYDEAKANAVLAKRDAVIGLLDDLQVESNPERYQWIPIEPYQCVFCPWWKPDPRSPIQCRGDA